MNKPFATKRNLWILGTFAVAFIGRSLVKYFFPEIAAIEGVAGVIVDLSLVVTIGVLFDWATGGHISKIV